MWIKFNRALAMLALLGAALSLLLLSTGVSTIAQKGGAAPATAGGNQSVISVNVSLVDLPVSVTDSHGNFVSGLSRENFQVYEDKHAQKIANFADEDIPTTVGLIVDHSGSMLTKLPQVSAAVGAFARSSNPKDEMFVVNFNDIVSLELPAATPFTSDIRTLENAVLGVSAQGRTALNDAIIVALDQLRSAHRERLALIIVSDGGDNASKHKFAEVLAEARRSKAIIYSIGIFSPNEAEQNPGTLEKLAKATGGQTFFPNSVSEVTSICTQIAHDIREQYTLGYIPSSAEMAGSYRKIDVKVVAANRANLHVRTRAGYVVPPKMASSSPVISSGKL
jgi:Ca-activated chloride channel family protein